MNRRPLLAILLVLAFVFAACGSDSDSEESSSDTTEQPTTEDTTTDTAADEDAVDESRDEVEAALEAQGINAEGVDCLVDGFAEEGLSARDMSKFMAGEFAEDAEKAALFTAVLQECLPDLDISALADTVDFDDPAVREQFIQGFAATSGLSVEQATCVLDLVEDSGLALQDLVESFSSGEMDPTIQQAFADAATACG